MLLSETISEKFVFLKYENGKLQFWAEDACGYAEDPCNAGVYTKKDVSSFGLRCFNDEEIKKKLYKKNIHFAVSIRNAIKYFM